MQEDLDSIASEIVGKVDVACRLISEAVRLFFDSRDPIAVHTLICSAHQVLLDIGKDRGVNTALKNKVGMSRDEARDYIRSVNYPYNYFKHADKDADRKLDVGSLSRLTQDFLMDAVWIFTQLEGEPPMEGKIYWQWFVSAYPDGFDNLPPDGEIARMQKLKIGEMPFSEISMLIKFANASEQADRSSRDAGRTER